MRDEAFRAFKFIDTRVPSAKRTIVFHHKRPFYRQRTWDSRATRLSLMNAQYGTVVKQSDMNSVRRLSNVLCQRGGVDTPDEIFISSPGLKGCDIGKISSDWPQRESIWVIVPFRQLAL